MSDIIYPDDHPGNDCHHPDCTKRMTGYKHDDPDIPTCDEHQRQTNMWVITRDLIDPANPTSRLTREYDKKAYPLQFMLVDDDNIIYYQGRAQTEQAIEDAHDWGMGYAGTTRSYILEPGVGWQDFI